MNELSAIVTDLDGALLCGSLMASGLSLISEQDVNTIEKLSKQGIPTFLVTGRPFPFVAEIMDQVGYDLPLCCCNGGLIYDFKTQKAIYAKGMPAGTARNITQFLQGRGIPFLAYTQNGVWFSARNEGRHPYWSAQNQLYKEKNRFVERFFTEEAFDFEDEPIIKILLQLASDEPVVQEMRELFSKDGQLHIVASGKRFLDISDAQANKAEGVRALARLFGFDIARTIAMGDNFNDDAMLRLSGIPVVTENGEDEMKAIAKFVTTSNNDSPLTHAIAHLFPALLGS